MSVISDTIDVNVPARTAYNLWTQFVEFPFIASPGGETGAWPGEIRPDTAPAG